MNNNKNNNSNKELPAVKKNNDNNLVKSLKYFVKKLNDFGDNVVKSADYIESSEILSFISDLTNETSSYIDLLGNSKNLYYKSELVDIINDLKTEIEMNNLRMKPIAIDKKAYYERATSRLMLLFRKQMALSKQEFLTKYDNDNVDNNNNLKKLFDEFWELIDWLQQNNISVLPDRIMICAYLCITIETYNDILNFCENANIKTIFQMFEENIISGKLNASEIGTRNNNAVKTNVSYDKVGNGLSPKDTAPKVNTNNLILTNDEIMEKMRIIGYPDNNDIESNTKNKNVLDFTD